MNKPWKCHQTGECCRRVEAVTLRHEELDALRHARPDVTLEVADIGDGFAQFKAGPCPFLDGHTCGVYDARPLNCRRWMCGRTSHDEPLVDLAPIPMRVLRDRDLRRQYALNQRRAMARWGHAHGWTNNDAKDES